MKRQHRIDCRTKTTRWIWLRFDSFRLEWDLSLDNTCNDRIVSRIHHFLPHDCEREAQFAFDQKHILRLSLNYCDAHSIFNSHCINCVRQFFFSLFILVFFAIATIMNWFINFTTQLVLQTLKWHLGLMLWEINVQLNIWHKYFRVVVVT